MTRFQIPSVLLAALWLGACASDHRLPPSSSEPLLAGSMGDVVDFSGVPEVTGDASYDYTWLDVRTRGPRWAAMAGLSFRGTLGEGPLAPGARLHIDQAAIDAAWARGEEPAVTMIGCSGPSDDIWEYDCMPQDLVVDIDGGRQAGEVRVSVAATFDPDCGGGIEPPGWDEPIGEPPVYDPAPAEVGPTQAVEATFFVTPGAIEPRGDYFGGGGPVETLPAPAPGD